MNLFENSTIVPDQRQRKGIKEYYFKCYMKPDKYADFMKKFGNMLVVLDMLGFVILEETEEGIM